MQVVKENALGIIDFIGAPVKPEREETALGWDLAASKMDDFFWAEDYSPEPEDDRFMSADGVHPNEVGYNVWVSGWAGGGGECGGRGGHSLPAGRVRCCGGACTEHYLA